MLMAMETSRTNIWLAERLRSLHAQYFPDVEIENKLVVRFGRKSKTRFGSIIAHKEAGHTQPVTYITINSFFKDEEVPEYVIDATLLHEFTHYTHGFHSPRKQIHKHPHRGNIVNKEIITRGAGEFLTKQDAWVKEFYRDFLHNEYQKRYTLRKSH